jgi:hypothetical protein
MTYEITVDFYDEDSDVGKARRYSQILNKYDARGIGHERTRTSSMFISSEKPLNLEQLAKDLGDIKILSVREIALTSAGK